MKHLSLRPSKGCQSSNNSKKDKKKTNRKSTFKSHQFLHRLKLSVPKGVEEKLLIDT